MKVAIVCGAPSSEFLAPFDDEEWEIWVLGNRLNRFDGRRVTRVFEIHDDLSEHGDIGAYVKYLIDAGYPMVVGEKFPATVGEVFPFKAAEELYGDTYLTSSPAYMIAYALLKGATHLGIYGCDMATDDFEYYWQRPCIEAWIGFAKGRGVDVYIPPISPLGRSDYVEGRGRGGKPDFAQPPFTQKGLLELASLHKQNLTKAEADKRAAEDAALGHAVASEVYNRLAKIARAVEAGQDVKTLNSQISMKG